MDRLSVYDHPNDQITLSLMKSWHKPIYWALASWLTVVGPTYSAEKVRTVEPTALELRIESSGGPVQMNQLRQLADRKGRPVAITRLDVLLSQFSLQRQDGSWTPVSNWHGFFRAEQPSRQQFLPDIGPGDYIAVRFAVGVAPNANHADPNRLRPDDPLHPVVNGMHWGWKGGYVFMALEGHWLPDNAPGSSTGGFSYHLGSDENLIIIKLAGKMSVKAGTVLRLHLNASRLLSKIDISQDGASTHSREQDKLVKALKNSLSSSFSLSIEQHEILGTTALSLHRNSGHKTRSYPMMIDAHMPSFSLPKDNPLTMEGVALGARLFNDTRLSVDNSLSCASCHRQVNAFSDGGKPISKGVEGRTGERNAMPLFNLGWINEFFWDGRSTRLSRQALEPIQHPNEMAETLPRVVLKLSRDRHFREDFIRAFGGPINPERIGLALEQYMLSIISQDSKFDRVKKGSEQFTSSEKRGLELFLTEYDPSKGLFGADCFHCHSGSLFTNQRFANNGLASRQGDHGRERVTGDPADRGKFRTPSLRNVAVTGPYMHDGRFNSLEEVVEHYNGGTVRSPTLDPNIAKHPDKGLRLSTENKAALVAFMKTLTDYSFMNGRAAKSQ